jgi:hypothetical protein
MHCYCEIKLPNLELKTWPQQLLVSLALAFVLANNAFSNFDEIVVAATNPIPLLPMLGMLPN